MERSREYVAIILSNVGHNTVIDYKWVNSGVLWIKFKFSRINICVVLEYGHKERNGEERERFWNVLDRIVDRVCNGYTLCVLDDLNGWIGYRVRAGITSAIGVPGKNENRRRVVEYYAERGLCVGNTYFEHKSLHKYARVARRQDKVEVKSMTDLELMKKDRVRYVQDVRTVREMGRGLSDHNVKSGWCSHGLRVER